MNNLAHITPELILLIANLLMLVFKGNRNFSIATLLAIIIIAATSLSSYKGVLFNSLLVINPSIEYARIIILALSLFVMLLIDKNNYKNELPILMFFSIIGMMSLVASNDFIVLYLGIELQAITAYVLTAINRDSKLGSEAAVKYFVLGAIASAITLYGISLVYGYSGSTSFMDIPQTKNTGLTVGLVLIIIGLAFKISAAPFHIWVPDVYQGTPTIVAAFFAIVPKLSITVILVRLFSSHVIDHQYSTIISTLAITSVWVSALGALFQQNLKRLIGYSSIGHIGYILMAVSTNNPGTAVLYTILYSLMQVGLFAFLLRINDSKIESLSGLSRYNPLTAACIAINMISMAGIPPLAGFFTKFYVIKSLIHSDMVWQSAVMLLGSVVAAYYYLRIVKVMYFNLDNQFEPIEITKSSRLNTIMILVTILNIGFLTFSECFLNTLNAVFTM